MTVFLFLHDHTPVQLHPEEKSVHYFHFYHWFLILVQSSSSGSFHAVKLGFLGGVLCLGGNSFTRCRTVSLLSCLAAKLFSLPVISCLTSTLKLGGLNESQGFLLPSNSSYILHFASRAGLLIPITAWVEIPCGTPGSYSTKYVECN